MSAIKTAEERLELKYAMDAAISEYIAGCTGGNAADVDYSYINQDVDDAIEMLGGEPAEEDY